MDNQIKIFLVDDHKLLRDTLKMFLESIDNLHVVGEAGNGTEAVQGVLRANPDLVLMDITLPDFDGVEATAQIIAVKPDTKIIAVTMHPEQLFLHKFLEVGGMGYIHKSAADRDLLKAIEQVQRGEFFLSDEGVQVMASQFKTKMPLPRIAVQDAIAPEVLSTRERQVLKLYAQGYSFREIADFLNLTISTINSYKIRITEKLHFTKRSDFLDYAIRHKFLEEQI
jgi:two-component system response regulator NreC